ncbi:MAG: TRAP transporter fused permease subunit, partial [Desulfobacterales bacterium]|nr:TRAP transporter fused permease subunit [Desulfobacterales bacterium]
VLGVIVILLILEATRRTTSLIVVGMLALFLLYPIFANYLPGPLHGRQQDLPRLIGYMYLYEDGIFGIIMRVITTIVIPFVLFGQFLDAAGAGKFFVDISYALMGRYRGGPGKIAVLASALVGTITGSASGNVATTGVITIPLMKKVGYRPAFAGAVEAVASNGGALCPPVMGATAFIMSEFTEIPYSAVCVSAALPAVLYFLSVFLQVDGEAATLGLKGLPRKELPSIRSVLSKGWFFLVPIGVLLYVLVVLRYHPVMCAFYSIATLIIVSMFRRETRMTPAKILTALEQTSIKLVGQMGIITGAGFIVASVGLTGLGVRLSQMLIQLSGGELIILLILAAAANYVMGMGLPGAASYILLAVLVAPALEQMGLPMIAAHMFIFYTAMWAHITPPVAPDCFVAAGIAEADPFRVGIISMKLAVVAYLIPFMFAFNPGLLLIGETGAVIFSAVKAIVAIFGLAAGIEGYFYFVGRLNIYQRALFLVSGLGLISPGLVLDVIGLAAGIFGFMWGRMTLPRTLKEQPSAVFEGVVKD